MGVGGGGRHIKEDLDDDDDDDYDDDEWEGRDHFFHSATLDQWMRWQN